MFFVFGNEGEELFFKIGCWEFLRSFVIEGERWVNWDFYILNRGFDCFILVFVIMSEKW